MMGNIFSPLQRIIILQGLEQSAGRELSNEMIQRLLKANGHSCSIVGVNGLIDWLEKHGYVKTSRLGVSSLIIVHITRYGIDIAQGNIRVEGVDPPPEV
jgi:Fe2+ or Zn2+ uptake regulation protein